MGQLRRGHLSVALLNRLHHTSPTHPLTFSFFSLLPSSSKPNSLSPSPPGIWCAQALEVSVGKVSTIEALNGSTVLMPCVYSSCIGIKNLYFTWSYNRTEVKQSKAFRLFPKWQAVLLLAAYTINTEPERCYRGTTMWKNAWGIYYSIRGLAIGQTTSIAISVCVFVCECVTMCSTHIKIDSPM